jgi:hypothetical protein
MVCRQRDYSIGRPVCSASGDIACRKLHLHFDNPKCHTARHVQEQMARYRCVLGPHPPSPPNLAISDFCLLWLLKKQLSGRTLDSEQNVLETVINLLSGRPKDEMKSALLHLKERCHFVTDHNEEFYPNVLNARLLQYRFS